MKSSRREIRWPLKEAGTLPDTPMIRLPARATGISLVAEG